MGQSDGWWLGILRPFLPILSLPIISIISSPYLPIPRPPLPPSISITPSTSPPYLLLLLLLPLTIIHLSSLTPFSLPFPSPITPFPFSSPVTHSFYPPLSSLPRPNHPSVSLFHYHHPSFQHPFALSLSVPHPVGPDM